MPHRPVCARCFEDEGLSRFIVEIGGNPGCAFCQQEDAPTAPFGEVAAWMRKCLQGFYSFADDHLPWENREGGYMGTHWSSYELLYEEIGLELPRDQNDVLRAALPAMVGGEEWCEFDWLSLEYNESLDFSWQSLRETVMFEQRFFFAVERNEGPEDPDHMAPLPLLHEIGSIALMSGLVRTMPRGTILFRARACQPDERFGSARELGPPPAELDTQANRMNPPGIPLMYAAETADTAYLEIRSIRASIGRFTLEREASMLDLAELPRAPGIFSCCGREHRLGLLFLRDFARDIARPVDRSDKNHIDYVPSQVVSEFFRQNGISGRPIDGIRYASRAGREGRNVALFVTQSELLEPDGALVIDEDGAPTRWVRLLDAEIRE